ncbi:MAG: S8 family serine peptidase [Saprospiraceae bacterium]
MPQSQEKGNGPYLVSNHSYGTICGWYNDGTDWKWYGEPSLSEIEDPSFGWYNTNARDWDNLAVNTPYYLIFKSAGNDRGDTHTGAHLVWDSGAWVASTTPRAPDGTGATNGDGYDCVSTSGTAKNIMTIGAVNDVAGGYNAPGDVSMSSFSGWGPTDDGRIKPDIVANGVGLTSSTNGSDTSYGSSSGTSMSGPSAAGSALLLQEHYSETHGSALMLSATLKALIIHTADEAGAADGPDYSFGWGLMNTATAASVITEDVTNGDVITENTISNGGTFSTTVCATGNPLVATIVWTDPAGTAIGYSLDNTTPNLVNDLDMRLTQGASTYMPYVLNPAIPSAAATTGDNFRDNVEKIYIPAGSGSYTLTVTHKGALASAQNFSLIVTGISVPTVNNSGVSAISGVTSDVCTDVAPQVRFTIKNFACTTNLTSCVVNYQVNGGSVQSFNWTGNLVPGAEEQVPVLISLAPGAGQSITANTTMPNGLADEDATNDDTSVNFDYNNFTKICKS